MSFTIAPGAAAPDFDLPGVDGQTYTLESFSNSPIIVVAFTIRNHSYVIGSEDRLIRFAADYASRGVALVAINSNETANHPEDDFSHMVDRAREKGYNFPYLRDEKQDAAKAFGAIKTPHFFVIGIDRKIRYTGRMDNNPKDESQATTHELRDAVDVLQAGRQVAVPVTEAIGCTVKWWNRDRKFIPNDVCDLI